MVDKERAKQAQIEKVHDIVDLMEKNSVHICPDRANRKSNCEISQKILVFIEDTFLHVIQRQISNWFR